MGVEFAKGWVQVREVELSDIAMLEAIVVHGSINKASDALHVTQPTLSKRLSRLEYKLGTQLFLRSTSGLTPTSHTQFILESSQPITAIIGNIERHIELMNMLEEGDLKLGIGPIVEQLYFPYVLHELTKSASSKLNISIQTEAAEDLKALLLAGELDVAVGPFLPGRDGEAYVVQPIVRQPLVYAARYEHPLVQQVRNAHPLTKEDLCKYPLIVPHIPQHMTAQAPVFAQFAGSRVVCDNYSIIKDFLRHSDHVSAGPVSVFSPEVQQNTLAVLPLLNPIDWEASCIARPESAALPMIASVIDIFARYELPAVELA